jgi:formylglycine-generating enzyme required for sulfatase activity
MVGNVWEWTTEWYAGVGNQTNFTPAMQAGARVNDPYDAWPSGYGTDGTWNVNSVVARASGEDNRIGIPSAAFRGGDWPDGTRAGVYSLYLHTGPSFWVSRRIPLRSATVGVGRSDFFRFMS